MGFKKQKASPGKMKSIGEATLARDIRTLKLPEPKTEYVFHKKRKWRFDFAWPDYRLAVEVDGGTKGYGRHNRHEGYEKDCYKLDHAVLDRWFVFKFTTDMVTRGDAVSFLEQFFSIARE